MASSAARKFRESRMRRNIGSAPFGRCTLRCSSCGRAVLFTPPPIVLVAPEILSEDGVDDVVWAAVDEARVLLKQLLDGFFDFYLQRDDGWRFLNQWHGFFLS